jgi:RND family efflux transporter MFP subunit
MTVVAKPGEKVTCPICGTHVAEAAPPPEIKKILYWTDPMIPGYKADGPGKSPMGMELVPVYEEWAGAGTGSQAVPSAGYAPVLLTPQKQQLIGVKTAPVQRKKLTKMIRAAGTIAHDPELYQAQAEYIQASQALERAKQNAIPDVIDQAQRLVDSTRIRLKHLGLNDELIQEIATWNEPQHSLLFAHPGEPVWMYAQVYQYELPLIRTGQQLAVDVPALPGRVFHGTIRAIDQMVDPMTRTTRIRAQLQDPQGQLTPDMYVNVAIAVDLGEVLALPEEAVFDTGTRQIVFVDKGQGLFEPRDVTVGTKAEGYYEVKGGMSEGEAVVTSGNFLIDSESRLKAAWEGMGAQDGQ